MISDADSNKDGNVDKLELYQYCFKSYIPDSELKWSIGWIDLYDL